MNEALQKAVRLRMERTAEALRKNQMDAYCVDTAADVVPLVKTLLAPGAVVSCGGSMTLAECGVMDLLRSGEYEFLDRAKASGDELEALYRKAFSADCYLSSTNAVTEAGELFNADGHANRVAALAFGPKNVIIVAGYNKIVSDLAEAERRLETVAAPANVQRFQSKTPCLATGRCMHCKSPGRICCTYVVHRFCRTPGRIKVILVGEALGF